MKITGYRCTKDLEGHRMILLKLLFLQQIAKDLMDVPNLFSELDDYIANKIQNQKFKFNPQLFDIVNQRFD